jgi:hypothetical protein
MLTRPNQIANFLARCMPNGMVDSTATELHQRGEIRLGPKKPWMPFHAVQTMSATTIAFRWRARFKVAGFIPGIVEDAFRDGRGRLDAWVLWFIRVAHARGPQIDRGEIQRYLAELAWCPMAMLRNDSLRFQELSPNTVRVNAFDDDTHVDLMFNDDGDMAGVETRTRYRNETIQPWRGRFDEYRDFGGVRLPAVGEVWWETPEGPFVYWRGRVTEFSLK